MTNGRRLDPRRLLDLPIVFRWLYAVVGSREWRIFAEEYVRARAGDRILDVGCGPADLVAALPARVEYTGIDVNERYVRSAERRFAAHARFLCRPVDPGMVDELGPASFDLVVAHGLLHHLDDAQAAEFFAIARAAVRPGGRVVTADGCYVAGQSPVARYLLSRDRGRHVRTRDAYVALATRSFSDVSSDIRHDTYRVPYTMVFLECRA